MKHFLSLVFITDRKTNIITLGRSPGLMVMGRDSHGFESWGHILDGHDIFSH